MDDTQHNAHFYEAVDRLTGLRTQRLIATPLRVKERLIGVMEVINKRKGPFTAADVRVAVVTAAEHRPEETLDDHEEMGEEIEKTLVYHATSAILPARWSGP